MAVKKQAKREQEEAGSLHFEVDAALLFQLGERSVARPSIAMAELIKNAYDADAKKVIVTLEKVTRPKGRIIVKDDGVGMTFEQITNYWMRIATDEKRENPISSVFCRPQTGAKGIGRFAVRRLADKLSLHSVAKLRRGLKEEVVVEFDWKERFRPGETLTDIPALYARRRVSKNTPTGVTLYLEEVKDIWDEEDVAELQRDILSLINPFPEEKAGRQPSKAGCQRDLGFLIELEAPEFPEYQGGLKDKFLRMAWAVLTGVIDKDGVPRYRISIRSAGERFHFTLGDHVWPSLKEARFRIHFFVYKKGYFDRFGFSVSEARRIGREQGGVRIYADGFRVFPYGELGDDWLELDQAAGASKRFIKPPVELQELEAPIPRRVYLLTPTNNQVFGAVAISQSKHHGIEINVSRERLVENETFVQLKRFVQLGIYWMTIQYARVTTEEERKSKAKAQPKVPDIIGEAYERVNSSRGLASDTKREILQLLESAKERAKAEEKKHISELSMLRVLSSVGAAIAIVNHQLRATIDGVRGIYTDLTEKVEPYVSPKVQPDLVNVLNQLREWHDLLKRQVSQLGFLLGPESHLRRRRLVLREVVDRVAQPLTLYMRDFGIDFKNEVPPNLRTPTIYEAELHAILLHIFTNALKAVKNKTVSEIVVRARRGDDGAHIYMLDTGAGIPPDRREIVFQPFVTDSEPDPILGIGTGLGLKVVRDLLETYGGTARFIEPEEPWKTCIEIILPDER